jgi:hypothetical protein
VSHWVENRWMEYSVSTAKGTVIQLRGAAVRIERSDIEFSYGKTRCRWQEDRQR